MIEHAKVVKLHAQSVLHQLPPALVVLIISFYFLKLAQPIVAVGSLGTLPIGFAKHVMIIVLIVLGQQLLARAVTSPYT